MTTIIGIKTNTGLDGIVLASDCLCSEYEGETLISKSRVRKLYYGDNWAMGCAGEYGREIVKFYHRLKGHKNYGSSPEQARKMLEYAIREEDFPEILLLNKNLRKKDTEMEEMPHFVFACNKPGLRLNWIDQYGNVRDVDEKGDKDFDYITIGNGSDEAESFINRQILDNKIDREEISIRVSIDTARGAIEAAEKKSISGMGYSLIVMTSEEVREWSEDIRKELIEAEEKILKSIAEKYDNQDYKDKR